MLFSSEEELDELLKCQSLSKDGCLTYKIQENFVTTFVSLLTPLSTYWNLIRPAEEKILKLAFKRILLL